VTSPQFQINYNVVLTVFHAGFSESRAKMEKITFPVTICQSPHTVIAPVSIAPMMYMMPAPVMMIQQPFVVYPQQVQTQIQV